MRLLKSQAEIDTISSGGLAKMVQEAAVCNKGHGMGFTPSGPTLAAAAAGAKKMKDEGKDCSRFAWSKEQHHWGAWCCAKDSKLDNGKTGWTRGWSDTFELITTTEKKDDACANVKPTIPGYGPQYPGAYAHDPLPE